MKQSFFLFCAIVCSAVILKGCISTPFEVAGDVIGAGFDAAGAVVEVPFEVAGAVLEVPGDIVNASWDGNHNHRLQYKTTESWVFDSEDIDRIHAETENGSIKVMPSGDGMIHLTAQINIYSRYKDDAVEYAENILIEPKTGNHQLSISTRNPRPPKHIWLAAHYTIYTPRAMDVKLNSSNALITIDDINGDIYAKTTNGKIIAHNVIGPIQAYTTNGRVEIKDFTGAFDVRTSNGNIALNANELTGNSSVETSNSKVEVEIASGNAPLRIKTTNGSVELKLPASYSGRLDAKTSNGRVRTEIPVTVYEVDRNELRGDLNGGGSDEIHIRSTNGSISIKKSNPPFSTSSR